MRRVRATRSRSVRLILLGAKANVDARGRVPSGESTVTPLIAAVHTLELRTASAGSTITGFHFFRRSRAIEFATGAIDDVRILNNRVYGFTNRGLFLNDNGINITIDQNDIDGSAKVGAGHLVYFDQDNFDGVWFTNNRVDQRTRSFDKNTFDSNGRRW